MTAPALKLIPAGRAAPTPQPVQYKRGEDTVIPNWLLDAVEGMTLASDIKVLTFLGRRRLYQHNTFKTWQVAGELGLDPRTTQASLKRLSEAGHILSVGGEHCLRGACTKLAHPLHKSTRAKTGLKLVQHGKTLAGKKEKKEEREEKTDLEGSNRGTARPAPTQPEGGEDRQPDPATPRQSEEGAVAPAADAAPDNLSPSQDVRTGSANGETGTSKVLKREAATPPRAPRPEHHGDDHAAVVLFGEIAGMGFVSRYRNDLARWHATYTPEFLRLAYQLAQTLPGARGMWTFADVLNRDPRKPWPDALTAQYARDVTPASPETAAPVVQAGDTLRWPDGTTATVLRVDHADAVTDAEDDARGYVSLSLIGTAVEVVTRD